MIFPLPINNKNYQISVILNNQIYISIFDGLVFFPVYMGKFSDIDFCNFLTHIQLVNITMKNKESKNNVIYLKENVANNKLTVYNALKW